MGEGKRAVLTKHVVYLLQLSIVAQDGAFSSVYSGWLCPLSMGFLGDSACKPLSFHHAN